VSSLVTIGLIVLVIWLGIALVAWWVFDEEPK
jgi:hypothetical protein